MRDAASTSGRARMSAGAAARGFLVLAAALCLGAVTVHATAPVYEYEVIASYPHDVDAFTQGLIVTGGFFYEGTGLYGESCLRKVEVETGDILKQIDLASAYFGEGVTALRDTIYQLTWVEHTAFSYVETDSFELIETSPYTWDGWGLTHDGTHLIASDGSSLLRFLDPRTLQQAYRIRVFDDGVAIDELNELEYIDGKVYANVWYSDRIAVIDPTTGFVDAWLDLGGLRDSVDYYPGANVLNGIAFEPAGGRLFVTGKYWPKVFEIDVPTLHGGILDEIADGTADGPPALRCLPNPCSGRAFLAFAVPAEGPVSLRLFDSGGRLVRTLVDDRRAAGAHAVRLDAGGLPAGTYFVRLAAGETTRTGTVRLIR
jgi:glutamine cyclotransferase